MEELLNVLRALPSLFGHVPLPARRLIATEFAVEILLFTLLVTVSFATGDDPFLRQPARYIKLATMCAAAIVALFVAAWSLFLTLQNRDVP
ncbi:MAG: hypothetical protein OXL37_18730 [Chloroflexota bacterium]|nr:hypothetical protein [Chloroflexota bacterium]MDE2959979.1 hypothetical protein [Chloroflexota bacterium]